MIQLSNADAEKVYIHLNKHLDCLRKSLKDKDSSSTSEINEARLLGKLINKINRKLDKECPDRRIKL